jgi:sodium/hydrogen antiporter
MEWAIAAISAALIGYAALSKWLERVNVSAAMFFVTAGLLFGPLMGILHLGINTQAVQLIAETTLTFVLFADASRISLRALRTQFSVPVRLLGIGLPLTITAGALVGALILPGVGLAEAFLLAVILACTDAALGQTVVTDERVPSRIRQGLNVESGLNDGICVPLFWIALSIAQVEQGVSSETAALDLVVSEIGFGIVGGIVGGVLGVLALDFATRRGLIHGHWVQILTAATAFFAAGIAVALHGSFFIAAFVAGLIYGTLKPANEEAATYLVDEGGELLNGVTFVIFGGAILWPAVSQATLPILIYAILSLTVVRMLPVAIAMFGTGAKQRTVAFLGWFGPRGLASIVFGTMLIQEGGLPHEQDLLIAIVLTVGISVYAHGISAGPLTKRYVEWYASHRPERRPRMESVPAAEHPWRTPRPEPTRTS